MEKTKGDEHLHHPMCEVCQKEFSDTHELSVHINEAHRNKGNKSPRKKRLLSRVPLLFPKGTQMNMYE